MKLLNIIKKGPDYRFGDHDDLHRNQCTNERKNLLKKNSPTLLLHSCGIRTLTSVHIVQTVDRVSKTQLVSFKDGTGADYLSVETPLSSLQKNRNFFQGTISDSPLGVVLRL